MCGLNGIFAYNPSANLPGERELLATRDAMNARGPDGTGVWWSKDRRLGLGHCRLSIIDLSEAGAQPMHSADGRYVVVYNGEIYNYPKLRDELAAGGATFATSSDTEVLLHLYGCEGSEMVNRLRGMFALAIWDNRERSLFLARDPYGIKPLYYVDDGRSFRFASQVKALMAGGGVSRELDPAGQAGFFLWGSVPEPFTVYSQVRSLPAGSSVRVDMRGMAEPRRFFSIAEVYAKAGEQKTAGPLQGEKQLEQTARAALYDSVEHHLLADVPVGAFLSAGIDSSALVGLMRDAGATEISTVTLSFEEFRGLRDDEAPLATEIAGLYQTDHATRVITADEFKQDLPSIIDAMDQPSIDGINVWFVSKAARERGLKVAVSGLGGDELFGGYPSFSQIPRLVGLTQRLPKMAIGFGRLARRMAVAIGLQELGISPKSLGLLEYGGDVAGAYLLRRGVFMPWELPDLLGQERAEEGLKKLMPLERVRDAISPRPTSHFDCVAVLEASLYMRNQLLRDCDWAGMAHSLEIRVPLVDRTLLETMATIVNLGGEQSAKKWLANAPSVPLPERLVNRRKTGFGIPVGGWLGLSGPTTKRPAYGYARAWANTLAGQLAV